MFTASAFAEIFELKNDKVQFQVDEKGNLISLKNLVQNREYAGGEGLWRIIYQDGIMLEESLESKDAPVSVEKKDGKIMLSYGGEFQVKITCWLDGDEIRFSPELKMCQKIRSCVSFNSR